MDVLAAKDARKFQVHCEAGTAGRFEAGTDTLSVVVGQRRRVAEQDEIWDSLHIICKEQPNGSLTVEVLVCHPEWPETRTIASIHSRPLASVSGEPSLWCDFEQQHE